MADTIPPDGFGYFCHPKVTRWEAKWFEGKKYRKSTTRENGIPKLLNAFPFYLTILPRTKKFRTVHKWRKFYQSSSTKLLQFIDKITVIFYNQTI